MAMVNASITAMAKVRASIIILVSTLDRWTACAYVTVLLKYIYSA